MHCLNCKSTNLICRVEAVVMLPLAKKGGTVLTKGFAVKQTDVKDWWDKTPIGDERKIRGPIVCGDCDEEHTYFRGLQPSLVKVTYAEAVQNGYEYYASKSKRVVENDSAEE